MMNKVKIALLISLIFLASFMWWNEASAGGTAFFKYERTTGMTKQCVYDYLGSEYTITLRSTQLCPLSIRVP